MEINIINITEDPLSTIGMAAGTSYGKPFPSDSRVAHCFNNGHMSVFEHASVTFYISGISRACSHQLVRHRMASFVQKSQRYTKIEDDDWYVTPPSFNDYGSNHCDKYDELMKSYLMNYYHAINSGIKPEDARYLLPEATKTDITMTMNVRELLHFFDLRCDKAAQWEIRDLANEMKDILFNYNDEWAWLIAIYEMKDSNE